MTSRLFPVPEGVHGYRLDAALARILGVSRSQAAHMVQVGDALVNGNHVNKSTLVSAGDILDVHIRAPEPGPQPRKETVPGMNLVYEDADIVVVDKPAGAAAHPSVGWDGPDVVGGLCAAGVRVSTSGAAERQGIVQRLDVGTSGLMVVAKSESAYSQLKQAFRDRVVDKTYHALVQGLPDPYSGTIDAPLGRHPSGKYKFAVRTNGRASRTHYELIEAFRAASLLRIHLETGRTHQIRVHMSALGHPCVGDPLYGSNPHLASQLQLDRQWLHAKELGFVHPSTGEYVDFTAPYPQDLARALELISE